MDNAGFQGFLLTIYDKKIICAAFALSGLVCYIFHSRRALPYAGILKAFSLDTALKRA